MTDDPWDWDVSRVVRELCTAAKTWSLEVSVKFPRKAELEPKIRQNDLTGEELLTCFDHVRDSIVWESLGLETLAHQSSLSKIVKHLRRKSQKYKQWKAKDQELDTAFTLSATRASLETSSAAVQTSCPAQSRPAPQPSSIKRPSSEHVDSPPPQKKSRRIAPINLSSEPLHPRAAPIPSFAEEDISVLPAPLAPLNCDGKSVEPDEEPSRTSREGSSGPLAVDVTDIFDVDDGVEFSLIAPRKASARTSIRQKVVSRDLRKRLVRTGAKIASYLADDDSRSNTSEEDELLPAWGDSDDEIDEETWMEIEKERVENEIEASKFLALEKVREIIEAECEAIRQNWRETKLPRLEQTAYELWAGARDYSRSGHTGSRQERLAHFGRLGEDLRARLEKLKGWIYKAQWKSETDLRKRSDNLRITIMDIEETSFKIRVLASPSAPPKPENPVAPRKARKVEPGLGSDEESILSDSDDGDMQNFVANDMRVQVFAEPPRHRSQPKNSAKPTILSKQSPGLPPNTIDLTQDSDEDAKSSQRAVVDSGKETPRKTTFPVASSPQTDVDLSRPPRRVKLSQDKWNSLSSSLRLLFRMMASWNDQVLSAMFRSYEENTERALWCNFVLKAILENPPPGWEHSIKYKVAVSWVRFFDAFVRGVAVRRKKFNFTDIIANQTRQTCKESEKKWPEFVKAFGSLRKFVDLDLDTDSEPDKDIVLDKDAAKLRSASEQRRRKQAARMQTNRELLSSLPTSQRRLVINESKDEKAGFVYVNENISKLIKDYQVDGVRFMWNQIIADRDQNKPQGCLLAHTMGLGKSMQVITFLVAMIESASARDRTVREQIPHHLRQSRTLILCPPTLVENWLNELDMWDGSNILGPHLKVVASVDDSSEKEAVIKQWAREGGVIVIGYSLFRSIFRPRPSQVLMAGDKKRGEMLLNVLLEAPNVVVADEAHTLKNESSQVNQAASQFRTTTRIALTGSPLSNNVLEYYSMINWVAENYLGPRKEFNDLYAKPIQEGLYQSSGRASKRKAMKKLKILSDICTPKMHRRTMASLKDSLPSKQEFVFFVPVTRLQREIYDQYAVGARTSLQQSYGDTRPSGADIFTLVSILGLVCNHPRIYKERLCRKEGPAQPSRVNDGNGTEENGFDCGDGQDVPFAQNFIQDALRDIQSRDVDYIGHSWKVRILIEILREARAMREKVLVFSQSILTLDYLQDVLRKENIESTRLDGKTPMKLRQGCVHDFNNNQSVTAFFISTKAGGQGLNIHAANRVVIFDFLWNPSDESQAIGRAYRIGQQKPVTIYRFVSAGTFEEQKLNHIIFKLQLFQRVVDQAKPVAYADKIGLQLLNAVKECEFENISNFRGKDPIVDKIVGNPAFGKAISRIMPFESIYEEDVDEALDDEEKREAEEEKKYWRSTINKTGTLSTSGLSGHRPGEQVSDPVAVTARVPAMARENSTIFSIPARQIVRQPQAVLPSASTTIPNQAQGNGSVPPVPTPTQAPVPQKAQYSQPSVGSLDFYGSTPEPI